ncbi:MAG TPA: FtsW/RodA/SpoVE family cell cycle protein, partial [Sphingomonadaceae bacterium]|nr:FtsW/RodA/SpoVE family cell cycle protein [Sphingomonadaceae bacterium]
MSRSIIPTSVSALPWRLIVPLAALTTFGSAVLYSAAGGSMSPFAASHLIRFSLFLTMALILSRLPRELVRWAAYPAYAAVLLLLLAVEAIGAIGGGSQRWLNLGPLVLQPSELMKPTIVLVLASFYNSLPAGEVGGWR